MSLTGSCLCGQISYEAKGDPALEGNCHCRDCQKLSGSAFMPIIAFPQDAIAITGEVKYYTKVGDSGKNAYEGFCPNCGSRVCAYADVMPGLMLVTAGTLDTPEQYHPQMELYVTRANHWDHMAEDTTKFDTMPPE